MMVHVPVRHNARGVRLKLKPTAVLPVRLRLCRGEAGSGVEARGPLPKGSQSPGGL
jgi:hypothetical protein